MSVDQLQNLALILAGLVLVIYLLGRRSSPPSPPPPGNGVPAMTDPLVIAVGPHQLKKLDDTHVTVCFPVGETTVLSVQPDGRIETRPEGACGPYEVALLAGDRLIYAPKNVEGNVYILPYASTLP